MPDHRQPDISAVQAHELTVTAEHALLHAIARLSAALVHADPRPAAATRTTSWPATARARSPAGPELSRSGGG